MNTSTLSKPSSQNPAAASSVSVVQPYLFFDGRCEEALEFYTRELGATITWLMRYRESPEQNSCTANIPGNKVMHAAFRLGTTELFASDGRSTGNPKFEGFGLSLSVHDAAAADRAFEALSAGGNIEMPLGKTFFSPRFGMVTDRFGVTWMVIVPAVS